MTADRSASSKAEGAALSASYVEALERDFLFNRAVFLGLGRAYRTLSVYTTTQDERDAQAALDALRATHAGGQPLPAGNATSDEATS